ncbi:hypothetical protein PMKS-000691 [Pichia membranifaciens]|uniref:Alcohol dehydrogenase-like N-terminal domain-containing protein n=1 Tax=Pichia membranifaciens TaxID=4926 RepID=A0A1Q2YCF0_9ASCO|nr:hypothetical protein PMKS-000691 [Pichia membranifaciens]
MSAVKEIRAIGVHDYDNWLDPKEFTYEPQEMRPEDVEIKVEACGICGSDIHAANGDWGRNYTPLAVGHEIVESVLAPNATVVVPVPVVITSTRTHAGPMLAPIRAPTQAVRLPKVVMPPM